jgi:hypothetical protein
MSQTSFSLEYVMSLSLALLSSYSVAKASPNLSPMVTYLLVPLAVAYTSILILNSTMPGLNRTGAKLGAYIENKTLGEINNMGYVQVFPPLLAVTILVFVLLFTNNLL